jgi:hypothetical protein
LRDASTAGAAIAAFEAHIGYAAEASDVLVNGSDKYERAHSSSSGGS